jgi:hypothetical protein
MFISDHYNNGSFKLFNRKGVIDRINGSTVDFLKEGVVVSTRTIDEAGEIVEMIKSCPFYLM